MLESRSEMRRTIDELLVTAEPETIARIASDLLGVEVKPEGRGDFTFPDPEEAPEGPEYIATPERLRAAESLAEYLYEKEKGDAETFIEEGGSLDDHVFGDICIVLGLDPAAELADE